MRKPANMIAAASTVAILLGSLTCLSTPALADEALIKQGKKVAENRRKGNCVTCHAYEGANMPGTIGPPLVAMKARFPDKQKLYNQIWDATKTNPHTSMPPFGKHQILSDQEIKAVTEWVYSL